MNIRPSTSRSTDRARSRSSHVSQPYFRRHTNAFRRGNGKKEVIKVPKDVFLFDTGVNIVPRGTKQAPLYENKQVLSSLKIEPNWTESEFIQKIEEEFARILNGYLENMECGILELNTGMTWNTGMP
eukprot:Seg2556.2 transcript_id=Seg2556.2/GoldUCD/mRNA.D3Y31 product="hypothetical protein" protein_id=Seg2556.2/GoldUCD/D3Y31